MSKIHAIYSAIAVIILMLFAQASRSDVGVIIKNPYQNFSYYHKIQVHAHSNRGCGGRNHARWSPETVLTEYKSRRYGFVCLTDHDRTTGDPGVANIVHIKSEESSIWKDMEGNVLEDTIHMLSLNVNDGPGCTCRLGDWFCEVFSATPQSMITEVHEQGGLAVAAHPTAADHRWRTDIIEVLKDKLDGIEIKNQADRNLWDSLISGGAYSLWGFAPDDFHNDFENNMDKGWIMVNSKSSSPGKQEIVNNIRSGNFYSVISATRPVSHFPHILAVKINSDTMNIEILTKMAHRLVFRGRNERPIAIINIPIENEEDFKAEKQFSYNFGSLIGEKHRYFRIEAHDTQRNIVAYGQPIAIGYELQRPDGSVSSGYGQNPRD